MLKVCEAGGSASIELSHDGINISQSLKSSTGRVELGAFENIFYICIMILTWFWAVHTLVGQSILGCVVEKYCCHTMQNVKKKQQQQKKK